MWDVCDSLFLYRWLFSKESVWEARENVTGRTTRDGANRLYIDDEQEYNAGHESGSGAAQKPRQVIMCKSVKRKVRQEGVEDLAPSIYTPGLCATDAKAAWPQLAVTPSQVLPNTGLLAAAE